VLGAWFVLGSWFLQTLTEYSKHATDAFSHLDETLVFRLVHIAASESGMEQRSCFGVRPSRDSDELREFFATRSNKAFGNICHG